MTDTFIRHERICEEMEQDPLLYCQRLYTKYLQGLFNFMPAGHWRWDPDQEITEIVIRGEAPLDMRTVGKKPAITVVMGPASFQGLGIDNLLYQDFATDTKVHTDLMSGNLVVYCLAESDTIAMRLAHIVQHYTRAERQLLEQPGGFFAIARPSPTVNTPSPPGGLVSGDPMGLIMVQVNIPFQFQWTWKVTPTSPRSQRSIAQIWEFESASDYPYTSPAKLEKVELAMSTTPVLVRRISGRDAVRPQTVLVGEGVDPYQVINLRPFGDEE